MIKKFFNYAFAEASSKGLNWLTITALPFILSPNEYGTVGLLVAIEGTLSSIMLVGQERAILRFTREKEKNVWGYAVRLTVLSLVFTLFIISIIGIFSKSIAGLPVFPSIFILIISIGLYNLARLLMAYSRVIDNLKLFWGTRFFYQVTKVIAVFIICYIFKNAHGYIYGVLISAAIFIIVYFQYFGKKFSLRRFFTFDKNFRFFFLFGSPLIFNALSGNILSYADRFLVQGFLSKQELGIYTFTYSLGSSLVFFYGITLILFEPLTYKYVREKKNYRGLLDFYGKIVPGCAFVLALLIIFFFKPFVSELLNPVYLNGYTILPILLSAHLLLPVFNIGYIEFIILNKPKFIAYSTIASASINILFNFLLIPFIGIVGAALSTLIAYLTLVLIIYFFLIQKKVITLKSYRYSYLQTFLFCLIIFAFTFKENIFIRILIIVIVSAYLVIWFNKSKKILEN